MTANATATAHATRDVDPATHLMALLGPIHDRARATARALCRSNSEGDDLFQDAVIRALTRLPALRDEQAFPAWFYRILLSLHHNRARRSFWRRLLPLDGLLGHEPVGDDGADWEAQRTGARRLREALQQLPAPQRQTVVLYHIDGYTLDEIAAIHEVSLSAVKSRLVRGRERLRGHYEALEAATRATAIPVNVSMNVPADERKSS